MIRGAVRARPGQTRRGTVPRRPARRASPGLRAGPRRPGAGPRAAGPRRRRRVRRPVWRPSRCPGPRRPLQDLAFPARTARRGRGRPAAPAGPGPGRCPERRPPRRAGGGVPRQASRGNGAVRAPWRASTSSPGRRSAWAWPRQRAARVLAWRCRPASRSRSTTARRALSADSSATSWARADCSWTRSSARRRERASRTSNWTLCARRATSACLPSGVSCRRISPVRSLSRDRLACMASSLRTVFSLRRRCLRMPAASSMKPRRSSGVACRTLSSWPWPTITCISRPRPESESSSWISSSRQPAPLMAYSEPPVRKRVREIVTSLYSIGRAPSLLSMVSETCARPSGGRPEVPAKITSSILPPRSVLAPCSPMTQASASTTLDLPEPLGPTTAVTPGSNSNVVAEANDLNPRTVRLLRCKVFRVSCSADWARCWTKSMVLDRRGCSGTAPDTYNLLRSRGNFAQTPCEAAADAIGGMCRN